MLDAENPVVMAAVQAALDAGSKVIQEHVGQTDGGLASQFWSGSIYEEGLIEAFGKLLFQEQAHMKREVTSLDAALRHAIWIVNRHSRLGPERDNALTWLREIQEQRGCNKYAWIDLEPDEAGMIRINTRGEGDRLVDLISVIIRG
jgi:hypothetical protein